MEELYRQNSQMVYRFLYSLCKDESLAEDLMQETFLRAFESLERFDGNCKISTWLCQIAKHLLYQHWGKSKKEIPAEIDEQTEAVDDTEQQALHRIELYDVWEKVEKMPDTMRQVVYLKAICGMSYREIAAITGKSETCARVMFYRAKTELLKED
ncbi:MAG: sigma-70 family RNA polymerase sigma factor [Roseburia sp.]|nr:sigma-70 family RNA polymerase sigma factor [Roseburia sp.]